MRAQLSFVLSQITRLTDGQTDMRGGGGTRPSMIDASSIRS